MEFSSEVIYVGNMIIRLVTFLGVAFIIILSMEYFGSMDLAKLRRGNKEDDKDGSNSIRQKFKQTS